MDDSKNNSVLPETDQQDNFGTSGERDSDYQNHIKCMPENTHCIYDDSMPQGRIILSIKDDKTAAYISIIRSESENNFTQDDILNLLHDQGITYGIKEKELQLLLTHLNEKGDTADTITIAQGTPPEDGKDGFYKLLYDDKNPFVKKDHELLKVFDPEPGLTGKDITGNKIYPRIGSPASVTAGTNVRRTKSNEFVSTQSGIVFFDNDVLSVENIFSIEISDDRMEARITCKKVAVLSTDMVVEALHDQHIVYGIDDDAIEQAVYLFNRENKSIENVVAARGKPCSEGRDATLEYAFKITNTPDFTEKSDGSIDIRETNIIQNVKEGEEVATITPHIDPVPGKDIFGRKITPKNRVKKIALRAGKNVWATGDGCHFYTEVSGMPVIENERISVNEIFSVAGDLDLSIGNIDFDGIVEISGSVEDGFSIKATKYVSVGGSVGESNIQAGSDIVISGGCNGKETARFTCNGDFKARYINESEVRARGDVVVKNEIVNSSVSCLGRVIVKKGAIRGGSILAKKGIETYNIGSDMGVKTILFPGEDFELREECKKIDEQTAEIKKRANEINKKIIPVLKKNDNIAELPEPERSDLQEKLEELNRLNEEASTLTQTRKDRIRESREGTVPEVIVYNYIYQGVVLKIGESRREMGSRLVGPIRLYEDEDWVSVEPYSGEKQET